MATEVPVKVCGVCCCDIESDEAFVSCDGSAELHHFHATDCLPEYFASASQDRETHEYFEKTNGLMRCPSHHAGCKGHIGVEQVAAAGPSIVKSFVSCTQSVACTVERRSTATRIQREAMTASAEANAGLAQRMMQDIRDVLTKSISCPHCHAPFIDFSGCLALTCAACSREFCGVCLSLHRATQDGHAAVKACVDKLSPADVKAFGFHSTYFITAAGWTQWSDKLKLNAIIEFFKTLRRDVVWDIFADVEKSLKKEQLLGDAACEQLAKKVYSHDVDAVHLVRIPNTFWLLYSTKLNRRFEEVVTSVALSQQERIALGKVILTRVRKTFPSWVAVKNTVPGEDFEAINYPPEFLSLITKVIDEWGRGKYW